MTPQSKTSLIGSQNWIEKEAPKAKKPANVESSPVSDDFDIENMLQFYGLEYWQNGDWHNIIGCPGKNMEWHEHCKAPGFILEDGDLGWCCWATSCDSHGKSAGWVIKRLNEMQIDTEIRSATVFCRADEIVMDLRH